MRQRARSPYPRRSPAQWQALKEQAVGQLAEGHSLRAVAEALHVSSEAVRVWFHKWRQGGAEAACVQAPLGAKPRLSPEQLEQLETALLEGPVRWGYQTQLWTLARIADLIHQRFGVRYHPSHVCKLLGRMGWSCQRPTRQAKERNEAAIAQWLREDWPRLKKGPKPLGPR